MNRVSPEIRLRARIRHDSDVVLARRHARDLASRQGLTRPEVEALATAVTEVAHNIVVHAGDGEIILVVAEDAWRRGVIVIASDSGPGIPDIERAMHDGFSTKGGLGFGLPGARRLVDEFEIESKVDVGTTITLRKWTQKDPRR
jgi:serine/threonine-protein kinase RsbT